jgi:hypothetical protein
VAEAAEAAEPPPGGAAAPPAGAPTSRPVDRDSLTEAWGDTILKGLPARAKALYSAGRFVSVDAEGGAHFALPNAAHRDRCIETTAIVEARLSEHFGTPVRLVLEVDDDAPPAAGGSAGRSSAGGGDGSGGEPNAGPSAGPSGAPAPSSGSGAGDARDYEPEDDYDPSAFAAPAPDPGDQAKEAEARLLQAFPGASEVAG